jgi:hypothetical protein
MPVLLQVAEAADASITLIQQGVLGALVVLLLGAVIWLQKKLSASEASRTSDAQKVAGAMIALSKAHTETTQLINISLTKTQTTLEEILRELRRER